MKMVNPLDTEILLYTKMLILWGLKEIVFFFGQPEDFKVGPYKVREFKPQR